MRLKNGNQVVIIGGGPSGSFTALHLLDQAAKAGLKLHVRILEPRDFNRAGPGGCNKCAGILSSGLIQNLERIELRLPPEVIQSELSTYILHWDEFQLPIQLPDPKRRIVSVYRGSGPRLGDQPYPQSFDQWLLLEAQKRGAEIERVRVQAVRAGPVPQVITARETIEASLLVLAVGVNSHILLDPAFGYQRPRTEMMAQDEITLPCSLSDYAVHVFFDQPDHLIFGGLIPKGKYANISLLGHHITPDAIQQFLCSTRQAGVLPADTTTLCGCNPQVAVSPARGIFSDRFVVVGDAAVTRLYKDGIGSAFLTAAAAAQTAVQRGVSKEDFKAGYQLTCQRIARDNFYGQLLFRLWDLTRRSSRLTNTWLQAIRNENCLPPDRRVLTFILWGMFTGDEAYKKMFWRSISLPAFRGILKEIIRNGGNHEHCQPGAGSNPIGEHSGSHRRRSGGYGRGNFPQARRSRARPRSSGDPC